MLGIRLGRGGGASCLYPKLPHVSFAGPPPPFPLPSDLLSNNDPLLGARHSMLTHSFPYLR